MHLAVPTRIEERGTFDVKPVANGLLVVVRSFWNWFSCRCRLAFGSGRRVVVFSDRSRIWSYGLMRWRFSLGEWQLAHPAHRLGLICGVVIVLLLSTRMTMGRRSAFF